MPAESAQASAAWEKISRLPKSTSVEAVVKFCSRLARELEVPKGVTSTVLLRAMVDVARSRGLIDEGSAIARFGMLVGRMKRFESVMAEYTNAQTEARRPTYKFAQLKVSENVMGIFGVALDLAKTEGERQELVIEGRHLVAALLDLPVPERTVGAWRALEAMGIDVIRVKENLFGGLAEAGDLSPSARSFWRRKLPEGAKPSSPEPLVRYLASYHTDDPSGADRLGIGADIEAMAALIASKSVQPPLSIGVFGDWGSGKSFFVHKVSQRVKKLGSEDPELFWPNITVIEFNAWHYVDSNLWASLVAHVFEQLRSSGAKQANGLKEQLDNLAMAQAVHAEAKLDLKDAVERLKTAEAKGKGIKDALEEKRGKLAENVAKDLWEEMKARLCENLQVKNAVAKFEEIQLGTAEIEDDLRALYTRAQEATTTVGRMKLIGLNLLRGENVWKIAGGFALATIAATALGAFLYWMAAPQNIAAVVAALTQLGGTALAAVFWMRDNTRKVLNALEPVEKARTFIEKHLREAEKVQAEATTKLEAEIAQELVAFKQATQEEADARLKVAEAEQAVRREVSGELIRRFVEERAGSGDYAKHLGLIAMIRDDFGKLSKMLSDHNERRSTGVARDVPDEGINRIVLVIDDLDRCPPARVVEVLEAVFLLLAFPAFVVVVAVDSRWVSHSLMRTYEHLLQNGGTKRNGKSEETGEEDLSAGRATPRDYLEKIFQIPYRVSRMNSDGFGKMIDELTRTGRVESVAGGVGAAQSGLPAASNELAGGEVPQGPEDGGDPIADEAPLPEALRPALQAMRLTAEEVAAMKELSSLVGRSPRATKRFVNIYRLLKASLPPSDVSRFENDEYRAAMVLLAVAHGKQSISEAFTEEALDRTTAALPEGWAPSAVYFEKWRDRIRQFSFES